MMINSLDSLIKSHEGCILEARPDAKGQWEIGWGHSIPPSPGITWSQEQADAQYEIDRNNAVAAVVRVVGPSFATLADVCKPRASVLVDMAYELGEHGLAGFTQMLKWVSEEWWVGAAVELRRSRLDEQVPARVNQNAEILETGEWPA
jgi:GH24 family phage-related lysozyme (muramidase)